MRFLKYGQNHPESGLQPFCGKTRNAAVAQKWFRWYIHFIATLYTVSPVCRNVFPQGLYATSYVASYQIGLELLQYPSP